MPDTPDDTELTEFELIEVEAIKGVPSGANGFPHLLMKGLADPAAPAAKADGEAGPTHGAFTGTHTHAHAANDAQGGDDTHSHEHTHDGDGDHGHAHGASKSEGPPAWHSPAALLARLARENPTRDRGDLFKAVAADGTVDEQPDIDGGQQAIALIAKLIGYEAAELGAGDLGEIGDISLLCSAADTLKWWLRGEQAGQADQAAASCGCAPDCACCMGVVMASTDDDPPYADELAKANLSAKQLNDLPDSAFAFIEDGGTKDGEGKTTPRSKRHFAIHDKAHADNAAARIAQGAKFGDQAKAKVEAAQKRFGEKSEDTSKSTVAEPEGSMQTDGNDTGGLAKAVEDAVTKAMAPVTKELGELRAFRAKVEALPVPGGPVMSAVRGGNARAEGDTDLLAKAAYFREKAETVTDPADRAGYRQLARETEAQARATKA